MLCGASSASPKYKKLESLAYLKLDLIIRVISHINEFILKSIKLKYILFII